ncbi:MAG: PorP/SprF family type IX secretion system membrane protein [Saprospiraceae bacterium]|nr:PorP/SprF family type IX secretion system membrane protein [Saprospiraceae bacterium]
MNKVFLFICFLLVGFTYKGQSQDAHFSQFYANPLMLNPALTGTSNGLYRVALSYRDQWRSAIDDPLRTYSFSGDVSFPINPNTTSQPDKFAFGINFFGDRVSTLDLNTTQISLFGAYHKALDKTTNQYLSAGLYMGLAQRNINYEDLTFEDQFNAIDGYTLETGEFLPLNNFGYGDFGLGVNYRISPSDRSTFFAGVGLFHINAANIAFFKSDQSNQSIDRNNKLFRKWSASLALSIKTTDKWTVEPRSFILIQGPHNQYNLGSNFKYQLDNDGTQFFHFGPWLRASGNVDGTSLESVVFAVGFETGKFLLGLSYDHSINDLTTDRLGLNAFEFTISYFGDYDNDSDFCPKF